LQQIAHRLPSQAPCSSHLNSDAQARLPSTEIAKRQQFGSGEHLTFQEPHRDGQISLKEVSEHRDNLLNLSNSRSPANTLMTKMRRPDAVFLSQEHLGISETSSRKDAGLIAGSPQTAQ
jgi:hypothetical protein